MRLLPRISPENRPRLLSAVGAAVLVVLCGTAAAVWVYPAKIPLLSIGDDPSIGVGAQPGASVSSSAIATVSPSASSALIAGSPTGSPGAVITATYKTIALLGLGGFDTEVTVNDRALAAWTVVLVMPADKPIENRSPSTVKMVQQGTKVTLTPLHPGSASTTFTVRFPALLALGKAVTSCTVNGDACTAISE